MSPRNCAAVGFSVLIALNTLLLADPGSLASRWASPPTRTVSFGLTLLSLYCSQSGLFGMATYGAVAIGRGEYRACRPPTSRVPLTVVLGFTSRKSRKFM